VGTLLAHAMCEAGSWSYIFGAGETTNLAWVMQRYMALHAGHTYIRRDDTGSIVATCTIRPPTLRLTLWEKMRAGLLMFPIYYGYGAYSRLDELSAFHASAPAIPTGAYYVTNFAVRQDNRGQGVGTAFLRDVLRDAVAGGAAVTLCTQLPRNVKLYERFGFEVVAKRAFAPQVPGLSAVDTDWAMVRR